MAQRLNDDEGGAVAVEYGFLLVFIVIAVSIGALVLGLALAGIFDTAGATVDGVEQPGAPAAPSGG